MENKINLQNQVVNSALTSKFEEVGGTSTYYIANNPKYYEVQRQNNFMFQVNFPTDYFAKDTILGGYNQYAQANSQQVLKISVNSAFIPHFQMSAIELKRGNNTMKFAGVPTFSNGQLKFDDFIGAGTKDILMAWQRKVYDINTEKVGLASDYKLDGVLIEYTPDYQVVRKWIISGCWISNLQEDDYSHESSDKHGITATIEYDKAQLDTSSLGA